MRASRRIARDSQRGGTRARGLRRESDLKSLASSSAHRDWQGLAAKSKVRGIRAGDEQGGDHQVHGAVVVDGQALRRTGCVNQLVSEGDARGLRQEAHTTAGELN